MLGSGDKSVEVLWGVTMVLSWGETTMRQRFVQDAVIESLTNKVSDTERLIAVLRRTNTELLKRVEHTPDTCAADMHT